MAYYSWPFCVQIYLCYTIHTHSLVRYGSTMLITMLTPYIVASCMHMYVEGHVQLSLDIIHTTHVRSHDANWYFQHDIKTNSVLLVQW